MAGELQPEQTPSADTVGAGLAGELLQPAAELLQPEQTPTADMVGAWLAGELLPAPDQHMSSAKQMDFAGARAHAAREMSSASEERDRGLLKELSTVDALEQPAPEHRAGLLQEERRVRNEEVRLALKRRQDIDDEKEATGG